MVGCGWVRFYYIVLLSVFSSDNLTVWYESSFRERFCIIIIIYLTIDIN